MIFPKNRFPLFGIMRQALLENIVYDSPGQLVSGSFMDYAMPRADNFCSFALAENEVPTATNPLGGFVTHRRRRGSPSFVS